MGGYDTLISPPERGPTPSPVTHVTVLEALRRHFLAALTPVALLLALALAIGLLRHPTYTSTARLNVGGLDLTEVSIAGYTTAVGELAVAYSRAIDATGVVLPGAGRAGVSPAEFVGRVSATPIENTSVITITATGPRPEQAVRLADAAGDALVAYATSLNSGSQASDRLLAQYRVASHDVQVAGDRAAAIPVNDPRHSAAKTEEDVARLKLQVSGFLYQQSQGGQATVNLIQKLAPAGSATSDRVSVLQQLLGSGLLAGALIGVGLAVARGNRVAQRRLRRA